MTAAISLSLANNQLVSASDLGVLPSLRVLDLSHNQLTQVCRASLHGCTGCAALAPVCFGHQKVTGLSASVSSAELAPLLMQLLLPELTVGHCCLSFRLCRASYTLAKMILLVMIAVC